MEIRIIFNRLSNVSVNTVMLQIHPWVDLVWTQQEHSATARRIF